MIPNEKIGNNLQTKEQSSSYDSEKRNNLRINSRYLYNIKQKEKIKESEKQKEREYSGVGLKKREI